METLKDVLNYVEAQLLDSTHFGGAWFNSKEELDNWAGDVLSEAIEYALNCVGVAVNHESNNGDLVEAWREEDSEPCFNKE